MQSSRFKSGLDILEEKDNQGQPKQKFKSGLDIIDEKVAPTPIPVAKPIEPSAPKPLSISGIPVSTFLPGKPAPADLEPKPISNPILRALNEVDIGLADALKMMNPVPIIEEGYKKWKAGDLPGLVDTITGGLISNTPAKIGEASSELMKAHPTSAASALAQAVPFFGPMTQQVQEYIKEGKFGRALGLGVGTVGVATGPALIHDRTIARASSEAADRVSRIIKDNEVKREEIAKITDPVEQQAQAQALKVEENQKAVEVVKDVASTTVIKDDLAKKAVEVKKAKNPDRTPEEIAAAKEKMAKVRAARKPKPKEPVAEPVVPVEPAKVELTKVAEVKPTEPAKVEPTPTEPDFSKMSDAELEDYYVKQIQIEKAQAREKLVGKGLLSATEKPKVRLGELGKKAKAPVEPLKPIEPLKPEPITDLDTQLGTPEPEALVGENSIFKSDKEATDARTKLLASNRSVATSIEDSLTTNLANPKDPAVTGWKLVNDVNRWLHGEDIDIANTRNFLSEMAARADEYRYQFAGPDFPQSFDDWKETISEMANWARKVDRVKIKRTENISLYSGIDPFEVARGVRKWYSTLRKSAEEKLPNVASAEQIANTLRKSSTQDEWRASKLEELLKPGTRVRKEDVIAQIDRNVPEFKDVLLGSESDRLNEVNNRISYINNLLYTELGDPKWSTPELEKLRDERGRLEIERDTLSREGPKFSTYVEPGGSNYKELFVTAPSVSRDVVARGSEVFKKFETARDEIDTALKAEGEEYGTSNAERIAYQILRRHNIDEYAYDEWQVEGKIPADYLFKESTWQDGHSDYSDIENPIVRLRMNDRVDVQGNKVLFIEELQPPQPGEFEKMPPEFQKRWREIGMKRAIKYAVDNGYDKVAWTTGEMQASRYTLDKYISDLSYGMNEDGTYWLSTPGNETFDVSSVRVEELPRYVGEDVAKRILSGEGKAHTIASWEDFRVYANSRGIDERNAYLAYEDKATATPYSKKVLQDYYDLAEASASGTESQYISRKYRAKTISGINLKNEEKGLRKLYDQDLPNVAKKLGGKIETTGLFGGAHDKANRGDFIAWAEQKGYTRELAEGAWDGTYRTPSTAFEGVKDLLKRYHEAIAKNNRLGSVQSISLSSFRKDWTPTLYSGLDPFKAVQTIKDIFAKTGEKKLAGKTEAELEAKPKDAIDLLVDAADRAAKYYSDARGLKEIKLRGSLKELKTELGKALIDRSGHAANELIDKLGDVGVDIVQKMRLTKGASAKATNMFRQMEKEVFGGLSKKEQEIVDKLVLYTRMMDIAGYKKGKQYVFPKNAGPTESAAYLTLFEQREGLTPEQAQTLKARANAYFEWMKRPLKEMYDEGLLSKDEYDALVTHKYRRIGTIDKPTTIADLIDKKYEATIGDVKRSIYDSGVERLARGQETDIYEPSARIMALDTFNRAYGRIANNKANRSLLDLARNDPSNPFVRTKINKGDKIPSGWSPNFVYEGGKRKTIYLSPEIASEWIINSRDISARAARIIRYSTMAPLTRTLATGIEWGFAVANLPRDVAQIWWAARVFEDGQWKSVYSPHMPVYAFQMGQDLATVFNDALMRKGRYNDYINEHGGMDFLVFQGRPFQKGMHLEGPLEKVFNTLGYFGETSEVMTRLAIRERVLRNEAAKRNTTVAEVLNDPKVRQNATFAARDYMDFSQGGWFTKAADQGIPYLNASIVGMRSFFRTLKPGSGTAAISTYKLAQFGAGVVGVYLAMKYLAPQTAKSLKTDPATQNNFIIPLGDQFSFTDSRGEVRHIYFKIPLDQNLRFFKKFLEASTDKWLGEDVDAVGTANTLQSISPVGISSLPPTISGPLGYMMNKNFWTTQDIWTKTDKPFGFQIPKILTKAEVGGSEEEYIPGKTPETAINAGALTGLSPERLRYAVGQLIPNSMWADLVGAGYEKMFGDLPKEKKEQHLAETLSNMPVVRRFIGITKPTVENRALIAKYNDEAEIKRWTESRGLDLRIENYLYGDGDRKSVNDYIKRDPVTKKIRDVETQDRMLDEVEFAKETKNLTHRSFWMTLKRTDNEAKAKVYMDQLNNLKGAEREQFKKEVGTVMNIGGFLSDNFWNEVAKLKK